MLSTAELFIIFRDYYWHFLEWGIGQNIYNGYGWHHILFLIIIR